MTDDKSKKQTVTKTRNFATVVYPESAPTDWFEILESKFIPAFISPLHDSDINPDGSPKKAHYHVMIMFDGPKTKNKAEEVFKSIGGVGCEIVNSMRGYARYLCHQDNPEKHQYKPEEVRSLCGADYYGVCSLVTDKYKCIREMIEFCDSQEVYSFSDLTSYALKYNQEWFRVLADNGSYIIDKYLKSKYWTATQKNNGDPLVQ